MIPTTHRSVAFAAILFFHFSFIRAARENNSSLDSVDKLGYYNDEPIQDFEVHVNCGGNRLTQQGVVFEADNYYTGSSKKYVNNGIQDIKNTVDDALYRTERSSKEGNNTFGYAVNVPNGIYEVRLHFAEIFWGAPGGASGGAGKRNFSVSLENQWLLSNYDIVEDVGSMTAVIKTFTVAVADGTFNLDFYGNLDQPKISAFELFFKEDVEPQENQSFDWANKAPTSTNKIEPQCIQVDDKLILIAGFTNEYKMVGGTEIYNSVTNSWSAGAPIPFPVTHGATALINGEIWILGGFTGDSPGVGTDKVQIYNVSKDQWRAGPALPKERAGGASAYYEGKLHFFGGFYPDRQTDSGDHFVLNVANPNRGWQQDTPMPNPRGHLSAALIDGIIYAVGGQHGHDAEIVDQKSVHAYNPATKKWSEKQALPYARSHFEPGTIVYDGQIVIVGGRRGREYFYDRITAYDPSTDLWREIGNLPAPIVGPSSKIFNGQLVITNGGLRGDWNPTDRTWSTPFKPNRPNLSIENFENSTRFIELYPNPVSQSLNLKLLENRTDLPLIIDIVTLLGQRARHIEVDDSSTGDLHTLDVSDLKNGIYFVTITQGKNKNSFKIIKE